MGRALPEGIRPVYDYGSLNDDKISTAEEIVGVLRSMGNEIHAKIISERFKLEEPKRFDFSNTKFFEACQKADVFLGMQGYVVNHADPEKTEYPIMSLSEDIRKLETLFQVIKDME